MLNVDLTRFYFDDLKGSGKNITEKLYIRPIVKSEEFLSQRERQ